MTGRAHTRKPIGLARLWRAVPTVLAAALLAPCAATSGGCESTGASVALIAGGTAGAAVGATVLTQSEVTVKVEVFVPEDKKQQKLFEIPDGPRLRQAMAGTSAGLVQVADALKGADSSLRTTAGYLDGTLAYLQHLLNAGHQDPQLQAYNDIKAYQTTLRDTAALIADFRNAVASLSTLEAKSTDSASDPVVAQAKSRVGAMLSRIREALANPEPIPRAYAEVVLTDADRFAALFDSRFLANNRDFQSSIQSRLQKQLQVWLQGDRLSDPSPLFLAIVLDELTLSDSELAAILPNTADRRNYLDLANPAGWTKQVNKKSVIELLQDNAFVAKPAPIGLQDRLSSIWNLLLSAVDGNQATVPVAADGLRQDMPLASSLSRAYLEASVEMKTYRKLTYAALLVDFNIGPITNEVVQGLLTSEAIDVVTDPENAGQWRPFAHATSRGMAGNHDAVIYFENLATPILKKAELDPTKFQVAYGQMFSRAFTTLADVYGVPMGSASDTPSDTNLATARAAAKEHADQAAKNTKAVLDAIEKLIELDRQLAQASNDDEVKQMLKKATEIKTALEK